MDKQVGNRTQNLGHQSLLTKDDIMNRFRTKKNLFKDEEKINQEKPHP